MEIELKNISKKYENKQVLGNFNLVVNKGEMMAITGQSGTGKSTLLNIVGLLEEPDSGDVIIQGIENAWKSEKKQIELFRYTIGYLFQNYALIDNETVSKNLDVALEYVKLPNKDDKKKEVLEKVGLLDKLNSKIYQLSGGEQQRIALARLMLKKNDIILADEPTGSLDEVNRDQVLSILKSLNNEGKTILIVTHDPEVSKICTNVVTL
ncbi:bacteriocin ABC transporter ATP-binding protein [Bacillus toyonensis]|uniref:putative bacteriocin export ABC transporter n=1 Tax=Bacillus toyonensis TaxID=155322 RepID=UPI000BECBE9B|nr:putative bacteriocin export ABC transporter [Bacillus toyonensis]PEE31560.1 bacteriocin ABC transporter ATP-binding protein [Bacillus toyonensis]PEL01199.1 bacteriocin ABC transporter ATP-binding protein [Bacillus toyonensis]PEO24061.1 bacteriocin ABC transporter ATP-binding protein [Bacillus toyonensis]PFX40432.1 bacteriocin ABC transporter ATP-binding protein [Bacillus toyonensis]PFX97582.1 bacteriocin ABC transporter ATP-binding protein [Bacillus toyonensis]